MQLIINNPRCLLQLASLKKQYGSGLQCIPGKGEKKLLVPFGNHARGAKFIDASYMIDEKLLRTMNTLCNQINGFHYGRLDIRFNTIEELKEGKNYSIIELNGAGSEPTHMYDPQHSIFFAWKEISFHYKKLFIISKKNHAVGYPHMSLKQGLNMLKENGNIVKALSDFSLQH